MGNGEVATPSKPEKASSSVPEQTNIHPYPDWATMQAYYGPGVPIPPPYFGTTVTPGHAAHPYMWGPQIVMPPYGTPYSAIYPHGGVYSHASDVLGSNAAVRSSMASQAAAAMQETPAKSSIGKDGSLLKKLEGPDGLAVSVCNGNDEKEARSGVDALSQSGESETQGSYNGDGKNNVEAGNQTQSKGTMEDTAAGKIVDSDVMARMAVGVSTGAKPKGAAQVSLTNGAFASNRDVVPPGQWMQDERELKREKRKQSNRESARRSRLRKQAETEELAQKIESLSAENLALKSEISQLSEDSAKLRQENTALMAKLQSAQMDDRSPDETQTEISPTAGTENFLSKIANSTPFGRTEQQQQETGSTGKLHKLLGSSPRADAAVAG